MSLCRQGLTVFNKRTEIIAHRSGAPPLFEFRAINDEESPVFWIRLAVQWPSNSNRPILLYSLEVFHGNEDAEAITSRCYIPRDLRQKSVPNIGINVRDRRGARSVMLGQSSNLQQSSS